MKAIFPLCIAAVLTAGLSGCVVHVGENGDGDSDYRKTVKVQQFNQDFISKLQLGTEQATVRNQLGTPDFSEAFNKQGQAYDVLFYRTHRVHGDGMTTKDECTALIFRQGELVGWGEKAYQNL